MGSPRTRLTKVHSSPPYTLACGGCGVHGKPENKANQSSLISSLHFSLWWVWCTTLILISCLLPRRAPEPPWMETPSTSLSAQVLLTLSAWLIKTQMCMEHTSPLLRDDPIHDTDWNGLQPQARGLPTQDRHHVPTSRGTQPRPCVSPNNTLFTQLDIRTCTAQIVHKLYITPFSLF